MSSDQNRKRAAEYRERAADPDFEGFLTTLLIGAAEDLEAEAERTEEQPRQHPSKQ